MAVVLAGKQQEGHARTRMQAATWTGAGGDR